MQNSEQKLNVYDIADAGPNHRFMIRTNKGPMLVHNCILGLGYGTGGVKLAHALATGLIRVEVSEDEAKRIVNTYRTSYPAIPVLWKQCQQALENLYSGFDCEVGVGVRLKVSAAEQAIILPNGMKIRYPELQKAEGDKGWPEFSYRKTRFRNRIYGAAVVENITQALARIIVSYQMCKIKQALDRRSKETNDGKIRRVVHMVHDEVIVVVPEEEADATKQLMERVMSTPPSWAKDLPVSCEAGVGKTYVEAK